MTTYTATYDDGWDTFQTFSADTYEEAVERAKQHPFAKDPVFPLPKTWTFTVKEGYWSP